jgi:hypothetical protein
VAVSFILQSFITSPELSRFVQLVSNIRNESKRKKAGQKVFPLSPLSCIIAVDGLIEELEVLTDFSCFSVSVI